MKPQDIVRWDIDHGFYPDGTELTRLRMFLLRVYCNRVKIQYLSQDLPFLDYLIITKKYRLKRNFQCYREIKMFGTKEEKFPVPPSEEYSNVIIQDYSMKSKNMTLIENNTNICFLVDRDTGYFERYCVRKNRAGMGVMENDFMKSQNEFLSKRYSGISMMLCGAADKKLKKLPTFISSQENPFFAKQLHEFLQKTFGVRGK